MNEHRFNELYLDSAFQKYVQGIIKAIYRQYKDIFQDNSIDIEDLEQECWASLYERVDNDKDKNYCAVAMKNAAIDFLRTMNKEIQFESYAEAGIQ
jgi:DNA-directed RNA polymerase specialized sigma24 family protein